MLKTLKEAADEVVSYVAIGILMLLATAEEVFSRLWHGRPVKNPWHDGE